VQEQTQPTAAHHTITTARRPDYNRSSALVRSHPVHDPSKLPEATPRDHISAIFARFQICQSLHMISTMDQPWINDASTMDQQLIKKRSTMSRCKELITVTVLLSTID